MTEGNSIATELDHWSNHIRQCAPQGSQYHRLDRRHAAMITQPAAEARHLIVSFERIQPLMESAPQRSPFGWRMREANDWASLTLFCDGHTWFRSKSVYAYFDTLIDEAYFDQYDTILFYGAGPCGYAAGAFCVSAPGARVLMVSPQATLDPQVASWDKRFKKLRRLDFKSRFGYAPDMIDGTSHAYIIFDPFSPFDAMHAALFPTRLVSKLKARHFPRAAAQSLDHMGILEDLAEAAMDGALSQNLFHQMYRARRQSFLYLSNLVRMSLLRGHLGRAQRVRRFMQPLIDAHFKRSERRALSDTQNVAQNSGASEVV